MSKIKMAAFCTFQQDDASKIGTELRITLSFYESHRDLTRATWHRRRFDSGGSGDFPRGSVF